MTAELALLSVCCLKSVEILAHHVPYVHDDRVKPIQDLLFICAFVILDLGGPQTKLLPARSNKWFKIQVFWKGDEIINFLQRTKNGYGCAGDLLKAFEI